MDNILGNANDVLNSMYSQREQLKGIKGKMMNIANQLGMSQTVMRLINKRSDQVNLYGFFIKYQFNISISYRMINCFRSGRLENLPETRYNINRSEFIRIFQDKLILWGGMFLTTFILFIIWKYYA